MSTAREIFEREITPQFETTSGADYLEQARTVAMRLSAENGNVTVDEVRAEIGSPPKGIDPRILGSVFSPRKHWQYDRYINSARRACHGRPVGVWKYVGGSA